MATRDEIPTDLTLEIGRQLQPDRFLAAARHFFGYIKDIASSLDDDGLAIEWTVRVREGSMLLAVEPPANASVDVLDAIYARVADATASLLSGGIEHPALNESALKHIRTLSDMTEKSGGMKLWVRRQPITVTAEIGDHIREDWRADYKDIGTIEGRLEAIQDGASLQIKVKDPLFRQAVTCVLPDRLLKKSLSYFRQRVEVLGLIHYRRNGTPISIAVDEIEQLPNDEDLPTADDVRGILTMPLTT